MYAKPAKSVTMAALPIGSLFFVAKHATVASSHITATNCTNGFMDFMG